MNTEPEKIPEEIPAEASEAQAAQETPQDMETVLVAESDALRAEIERLKTEFADSREKMLRALADAENTRRRALKERDDAGKYAVAAFARDLLDLSDNFTRAMAAIPPELHQDEKVAPILTGLEAMNADFLRTMERHGIKKIEPLDEPFNPNFHEVLFEAPVPGKPGGVVIQVVEAGYVLNERLLRAAKVGISKGGAGTDHQVDQSA